MLLLNPRRTRTNMKLLQLVWIFLLTLCGQSGITAVTVNEDVDVILNCSFGTTNIKNEPFAWKKDVDQSNEEVFWYSGGDTDPGPEFKGRVFHFPDQLQFGNASIKIIKAKTSDSGNYTCYHATVQKEIKSTTSLTVGPILKDRSDEKIEGASPKPSIEILSQTKDSALLQCEVLGAFPKPEVVWTDSDGKILPADELKVTERDGNKYDVILNVTVTKTDRYRCVATQKEIYHQVHKKTLVHLNGGALEPWVTILGETENGMRLQCVVRGASPKLRVSWKNSAGHDVSAKEQKTRTGGGYNIVLQTTVTKTDYYRCVTTEGKKDDELHSEIFVRPYDNPRSSVSRLVPAAVLAVLGLVAAVVV